MPTTIPITDEIFARLAAAAALGGTTVESLAALALDRAAREVTLPTGPSAEEWVADLRAWVGTLPRRPATVDDSRESTYDDRGR